MNLDTFKSLYPDLEELDYLSKNFYINNWWGYFAVEIIEDAEPYNQPYQTKDGKMWSVVTIEDLHINQELIEGFLQERPQWYPPGRYLLVIRGCDDYSYAKYLNSVKECYTLWNELFGKTPLTLSMLEDLGFHFNN